MLEHNGRFNSRDYDKFERMELMESPVRDANQDDPVMEDLGIVASLDLVANDQAFVDMI